MIPSTAIVVYPHTYTSGNIIKHNLQTSMNKQHTLLYKNMYLSHFILSVSVVCKR